MNEMLSLFENGEVLSEEVSHAVLLHQEILFNRDKAAEHLYTMCRQIKEMRDTQAYRSLGFEDFDSYVEQAVKIKRRQAYNYIRIVERLGDSFVQSNAQLGVTKLEMLTDLSPDDREELAEENSLEEISVRELKEKIEELKERTKQLSFLEDENAELKQELSEKSKSDTQEFEKRIAELEEENRRLAESGAEATISDVDFEQIKKDIEKEVKNAEKEKRAAEIQKAVDKAKADAEKDIESQRKAAAEEAVKQLRQSLAEIEAEKAEALERAEEFRKKLEISNNADTTTFKYLFEECQGRFNKMLSFLDETREKDGVSYEKMLSAAQSLVKQMGEALGA